MSEEMEKADLQRNRRKYETGQTKFLLYSERAHYYKKVNLTIVKNIVFYSLPEDPEIFKELVELTNPSIYKEKLEKLKLEDKNDYSNNDSAVITLANRSLEIYQLEKVIGYSQVKSLLKQNTSSYVC